MPPLKTDSLGRRMSLSGLSVEKPVGLSMTLYLGICCVCTMRKFAMLLCSKNIGHLVNRAAALPKDYAQLPSPLRFVYNLPFQGPE